MSFIREDRFGRDATGWQFDLLLGSVWDEILDVCNSATDVSELGYPDGDRWIDGSTVAEDILQQGGKLLGKLLARADAALYQSKSCGRDRVVVAPTSACARTVQLTPFGI